MRLTKKKPNNTRIMKIKELVELLKKEFTTENGDIDISDLDFGDFRGALILSGIKSKGDIKQSDHSNKGSIDQYGHSNKGHIYQSDHSNKGDIDQSCHSNDGYIYQSRHGNYGDIKQFEHSNDGKVIN